MRASHAVGLKIAHHEHGHLVDHAVHLEVHVHFRYAAAPGTGLHNGLDVRRIGVEALEPSGGERANLLPAFKAPVRRVDGRQAAELPAVAQQGGGLVRLALAQETHQQNFGRIR